MPKSKAFGKRKCHPNQHKNKITKLKNEAAKTEKEAAEMQDCSSSKKKIKLVDVSTCQMDKNRIIIEIGLLSALIQEFVKCKHCDGINCVVAEEQLSSRRGLASSITLNCTSCGNAASTMSSSMTTNQYDVNLRLAYGMRCIGKSKNAADVLCGILNLPPPPTKFSSSYEKLLESLVAVSNESMCAAVEETVAAGDCGRDISAAFDGTWQKRGFTSLNGVVVATSVETGKVMDVECMTKYCSFCAKGSTPESHLCQANYTGTSGGMEVEGVRRMFERSIEKRSVRYINYLGDGDSKAYDNVESLKVYGEDVSVTKLECIGHVQKRMGSRLLKLREQYKGKPLSDGLKLSGHKRLTKEHVKLIQAYYGLAITRNIGKPVSEMRNAIWAIYFHKLSTDETPQHGLCPTFDDDPDTWCEYNKSLVTGKEHHHKHSLPEAIMEAIKPVFRALSCPKLLEKCLHGKTQNPNESFNHCIWERLPKTSFVGPKSLEIGVLDAVICFNDGSSRRKCVLEHMGLEPGYHMLNAMRRLDNRRVAEAERAFKNASKDARKNKKRLKRALETSAKLDTSEYGGGLH